MLVGVVFLYWGHSADKQSKEARLCLNGAHAFRAYVTDDVIAIEIHDPTLTESVEILNRAFDNPIQAGQKGRYASTRIDVLDKDGGVLRKLHVNESFIDVGPKRFAIEGDAFLRPFRQRYSARTYFHPDGSKRAEGVHRDREKDGPWIFFHSNGAKASEGHYIVGRKVGKWTEWDESGQVVGDHDFGPNREGAGATYPAW